MSGHWPPGWDDQDDDFPGEADQPGTEAGAGLSEVAAYLASVPAPVMPGSVEARISAALAAEAASRAGIADRTDSAVRTDSAGGAHEAARTAEAAGPRVLGPVPAAAPVRPRGARGPRGGRDRRRRLGQVVLGSLAACLLLVFIGLGLSRAGSSSSSSSASSLAGAPAISAAAGGKGVAGSAPVAAPAATGTSPGFVVSATGTGYQRATLAQQARAQLLATRARESARPPAPTASSPGSVASPASGAAPGSPPSPQLRACVLKVTGGVLPGLVDRATYQGTPAYVIVSANRVWVAGLGCTAARPQVITSLPLAG